MDTPPTIEYICSLYHENYSVRRISERAREEGFKCSPSAVQRLIRKAAETNKNIREVWESRRKNKLDRIRFGWIKFIICCKNNRSIRLLAEAIRLEGYKVSDESVRSWIERRKDPRLLRPLRQPAITKKQKRTRRRWCQEYLDKMMTWSDVLFADEKAFTISGPAFRPRMLVFKEEKNFTVPQEGKHQPTINFFGCFSVDNVPSLVSFTGSLNKIMYSDMLSEALWNGCVFMHDRHTAHTAKFTRATCESIGVQLHTFPPKGCDINPMEHVWAWMAGEVYKGNRTYDDVDSLRVAVEAAWDVFREKRDMRINLANSVPTRLSRVVKAHGGFAPK